MLYAITAILSLIIGAAVVFVLCETKRRAAKDDREKTDQQAASARKLMSQAQEAAANVRKSQDVLARDRAEFREECESIQARTQAELELARNVLAGERQAFDTRIIRFDDLDNENRLLKRDLRNIDVTVRKLQLDRKLQADMQEVLDKRAHELAEKHLGDVEKWVTSGVSVNNYAACKQRLTKAIEWCRELGYVIPEHVEQQLLDQLRTDYERKVREALAREEQAAIRARMREEAQREREVQRAVEAAEREKMAIREALNRALAEALSDATAAHTQEVEQLKVQLAEAEAKAQRTISQAQLTKVGHIYVISNIGAFGEGLFKIGMTRRLNPEDRIDELGDASVPFPFDVHMMISCPDAPALENALHREFHKCRVNKVNPRKEYFRVDLERVRDFVVSKCGEVEYTAVPEAFEFRQSLEMSDADQEYIERVFEEQAANVGLDGIDE